MCELGAGLRGKLAEARDLYLGGLRRMVWRRWKTIVARVIMARLTIRIRVAMRCIPLIRRKIMIMISMSDSFLIEWIFTEDPAKEARQRICEALKRKSTNFSKDPEAENKRSHRLVSRRLSHRFLQFIVLITSLTGFKTTQVIEHASTTWKQRDPMQINDWFAKWSPKKVQLCSRSRESCQKYSRDSCGESLVF